jgi:hypothetical protein
MGKKELKSDKFVVYVLPASTSKPLIRIFKCDSRGKQTNIELHHGGLYPEDCELVGKLIVDNSKNIADFKKDKLGV